MTRLSAVEPRHQRCSLTIKTQNPIFARSHGRRSLGVLAMPSLTGLLPHPRPSGVELVFEGFGWAPMNQAIAGEMVLQERTGNHRCRRVNPWQNESSGSCGRRMEAGGSHEDLCRRHNIRPPTFYRRKKQAWGMGLSGVQRLREPAYVVNKKPVQWIRREEGLPQQSPGLQTPAQFAQSQE